MIVVNKLPKRNAFKSSHSRIDKLIFKLIDGNKSDYFAGCDYIDGKWRWFIAERYAKNIICTANSHKTLISSLKKAMKRAGCKKFSFCWDNDETRTTVSI